MLSLHDRDPKDVMRWMDRAQRPSANRVFLPSELIGRHVSLAELPDLFQHGGHGGTINTLLDLTSRSSE